MTFVASVRPQRPIKVIKVTALQSSSERTFKSYNLMYIVHMWWLYSKSHSLLSGIMLREFVFAATTQWQ